jgi:hypothetical protein
MSTSPRITKRGPYRRYLFDKYSPVPKTTRWRIRRRATTGLRYVPIYSFAETSD